MSSDRKGDTGEFVQRVDGMWASYDVQPSGRCRPEARDDGVPEELLPYFRGCETSNSSDSADDLGLATPITVPECDDTGIVVLGAATTPGSYGDDVEALLQTYPDASYLRADASCPSLAQATEGGDPIFAVYRPAGKSADAICAAVNEAGGQAYGKRLDTTSDPTAQIDC